MLLVFFSGESRVNGNGATPPRTPPGTPKKTLSRSSSPKTSTGNYNCSKNQIEKSDDSPPTTCKIKLVTEITHPKKKASKICYKVLNNHRDATTCAFNHWCNQLQLENLSEFKKCFSRINKITNIVKLRNFQFRLLHNKIFCNNVLSHWGVVPNNCCEYCEKHLKQTPLHLFFESDYTQNLWNKTKEYLSRYDLDCEISAQNIILNNVDDRPSSIVNFIILLVKQLIFRYKCEKKRLVFTNIENEIDTMYHIEKYNAIQGNNYHRHVKKWKKIKPDCLLITDNNTSNHANDLLSL